MISTAIYCDNAEVIAGIGTDWANPNYAKISDNDYAASVGPNQYSNYLRSTSYVFDVPIPEGATITGVTAVVHCYSTIGGVIRALGVNWVIDNVVDATNNYTPEYWPTSASDVRYPDRSGRTWTREELIDADFGYQLAVVQESGDTEATAYVNFVGMEVEWEPAGTSDGAYCTYDYCDDRINDMSGLIPDDKTPQTYIEDLIADAGVRIDAALRSRYTVPFTTVPPEITDLCFQMVRYQLYLTAYSQEEATENEWVLTFKRDVDALLKSYADGSLTIAQDVNYDLPVSSTVDAEREFTIDSMKVW